MNIPGPHTVTVTVVKCEREGSSKCTYLDENSVVCVTVRIKTDQD